LHQSRLGSSYLAGSSLAGTDLSSAEFTRGPSGPVTFVANVDLDGESVTLQPSLAGANLDSANFQGARLVGVNLQRANLRNTNFRYADLHSSDFSQADLAGADLRASNLQNTKLSNADLTETNLIGADLIGADLSLAIIDGTQFASVTSVDFPPDLTFSELVTYLYTMDCPSGYFLIASGNVLNPATIDITSDVGRSFYNSGQWQDAISYICAANMSGVTTRGTFGSSYLAGVDMSEADLNSTDLSKTTLVDTVKINDLSYALQAYLAGATYNSFTIWPVDFVPPAKPSSNPASER
jgi:uncharacterized protein YjbI with pentapeptide repeats